MTFSNSSCQVRHEDENSAITKSRDDAKEVDKAGTRYSTFRK